MQQDVVTFDITKLGTTVAEGVLVEWQGREFNSGPLIIELDEDRHGHGVLDYDRRRARAEFPVRLKFPEFADLLESLGADPELTQPVRGVLRSEGDILDDHSFQFRGSCELFSHPMFGEAAASVLPGH